MQITRTTPLRLITLQLRQIFLTEARTFIAKLRKWKLINDLRRLSDSLFSTQTHTAETSNESALEP